MKKYCTINYLYKDSYSYLKLVFLTFDFGPVPGRLQEFSDKHFVFTHGPFVEQRNGNTLVPICFSRIIFAYPTYTNALSKIYSSYCTSHRN